MRDARPGPRSGGDAAVIKLIGAAVTVISFWAAGAAVASAAREKAECVGAFHTFLCELKRQMVVRRAPLGNVFASYRDERLEKRGFLKALRGAGSVSALWNAAVATLPLDARLSRAAEEFGGELGKTGLDGQTRSADALIELVGAEREALERSLADRQKSIRVTALLIGALAALILY